MRESVGATWIFSICLTFIILFTAYLAISVNYAKAFRIKNYIISTIEENEGMSGNGSEDRITSYLTSEGYTASGRCSDKADVCINANGDECGVCIYRTNAGVRNDDVGAPRTYYKVEVFFQFDLPVVGYFTKFKVSGDTRYIYDFS